MNKDTPPRRRRYIVNAVYTLAVGHIIEGISIANALRGGEDECEIALLVNGGSALEILSCVSHLRVNAIPVDLESAIKWSIHDLDRVLSGFWTFAITIHDEREVCWGAQPLVHFHRMFRQWAIARSLPGWVVDDGRLPRALAMLEAAPRLRYSPIRLYFDEEVRRISSDFLYGSAEPRILILLGAGTPEKTPTLAFWKRLIIRLLKEFPSGSIILVGKTGGKRGATAKLDQDGVAELLRESPRIRSVVDFPIVQQLSIGERCTALIGPHSGMAFALQCAQLPWVALSGWTYHEYFTNGIPILPIRPRCPRYPCDRNTILPICSDAVKYKRSPVDCLSDGALKELLPVILLAVRRLVQRSVDYKTCIADYRRALSSLPGASRYLWENSPGKAEHPLM